MKRIKVLFVPGYAGSTLIERKTRKLRWVRLSDFLSNKYDLRMTESYSDIPIKNDLIADQILMKVKLIPKILEIESYGKTLKHLNDFCKENQRELHTVTYDWRDDFYTSIQRIGLKIEEMTKDGERIEVVAHSTGALLMTYYLRYGMTDFFEAQENWYGTNKISKMSFVAAPFRGAFSLFRQVKYGVPVLKNKRLMGSLDYSTFRSTYFFLPPKEHQWGYGEKGKLQFDCFDIKNWQENQWGPYRSSHQEILKVNADKFGLILMRSKKFHELLNAEVAKRPETKMSLQVLKAVGYPTFFYPTLRQVNNKDGVSLDYEYPRSSRIDGDGVIANFSADPLRWFSEFELQFQCFKSSHLKIISDIKFQKNVHNFLLKK